MAAEDDRPRDWAGTTLAVRYLVDLHRQMGTPRQEQGEEDKRGQASPGPLPLPQMGEYWCVLVEEYSTRRLTFGTDKIPATVGMAHMFRARSPDLGEYVAGLWRGDLARGLCWGPRLLQWREDRKRPGYVGNDLLAPFARPDKTRASSWSWASVDGSLYFPCSRKFVQPWVGELEVLDIKVDEGGCRAGALTLRGRVGKFDYVEPKKGNMAMGDVGLLNKPDEEGHYAGNCALDFDRHVPRKGCYALLAASLDVPRKFACFLVMEKIAEGMFRRIGISTVFYPPQRLHELASLVNSLELQQLTVE